MYAGPDAARPGLQALTMPNPSWPREHPLLALYGRARRAVLVTRWAADVGGLKKFSTESTGAMGKDKPLAVAAR